MGYETSIHSFAAITSSAETPKGGALRGFTIAVPISILLWAGIIAAAVYSFSR